MRLLICNVSTSFILFLCVLYVWLACLLDMAMCTCMKLSLALHHMWALARMHESLHLFLNFVWVSRAGIIYEYQRRNTSEREREREREIECSGAFWSERSLGMISGHIPKQTHTHSNVEEYPLPSMDVHVGERGFSLRSKQHIKLVLQRSARGVSPLCLFVSPLLSNLFIHI